MQTTKAPTGMAALASTALVASLLFVLVPFANAKCSATSTPQGVYRDAQGTIMSDSDGVGSNTNYAPSDRCTWYIQCPENTTFTMTSLLVRKYRSTRSDEYIKLTGTDDPSGTLLGEWKFPNGHSISQRTGMWTPDKDVRLDFQIAENTATRTGAGFTMEYQCLPSRCQGKTDDGRVVDNGMMLTNAMGGVSSNSDPLISGEQCVFSIDCPAGTTAMAVYHSAYLRTGTVLDIGDQAITADSAYRKGWQFVDGNAPSTAVNYTATTTRSSAENFQVEYHCGTQQCSSRTAGQTFTDTEGSFMTDIDGAGQAVSVGMNETCSWRIECPAESKYLFYWINGYVNNGYNVTVAAQPSGSILLQELSTRSTTLGLAEVLELNAENRSLELFFRTRTWNVNGYGLTVNYRCANTRCGSLSAGETLTEASGVILTDLDGWRYGTSVLAGEVCQWDIACPAGYQHGIALREEVGTGYTGSPWVLESLTSGKLLLNNSRETFPALLPDSRVRLLMNSTETYSGRTWRYQCMSQPNCTSPNSSSLTTIRGTVWSDFDGPVNSDTSRYTGDFLSGPGLNCTWTVTCPDDPSIKMVRISSEQERYQASNYSIRSLNGSHTYALAVPSVFQPVFVPGRGALMQAFLVEKGSEGMAMSFECLQRQCPAEDDVVFGRPSGTIKTDKDGYGSSVKCVGGDSCRWKIQCPSGYDYVNFYVKFNRWPGTNLTASNGRSTHTLLGSGNYGYFNVDGTSLDIAWDVPVNASGGWGATLDYECRQYNCTTAQNQTITALNGTLTSDIDGHSWSTKNKAGAFCTQRIVCPNNAPFIAMNVRYGLDDSDVDHSFSIGDVVMKSHTSSWTEAAVLARTEAGAIDVVYDLANPSDTVQQSGYTIDFECRDDPCSLFGGTNIVGVTSGSIVSSFYGDTSYRSPGLTENCTWHVTCPVGMQHMRVAGTPEFEPTMSDSAELTVMQMPRGPVASRSYTTKSNPYFSDAFNGTAGIALNVAFSSSNAGLPDFDPNLSFDCRSCQYKHSADLYLSRSKTMMSDADGSSANNRSIPGDSCYWHARCPTGRVKITAGSGNVFANLLMAYEGPSSFAATGWKASTMPELAHFTGYLGGLSYTFNTSSVLFLYNVTEDAIGFTLELDCDKTVCVGGKTTEDPATGVRTYETDVDGAGPNLFTSGTCIEDLTCPPGKPTVSINMTVSLAITTIDFSSGALTGGAPAPVQFNRIPQQTRGTNVALKMPAPTRMRLLSSGGTNGGNWGLTVRYTCSDKAMCRSPTPDGSLVVLPGCEWGSPCVSKTIGVEPSAAQEENRCNWFLQCPAGQLLKLRSFSSTLSARFGNTKLTFEKAQRDYYLPAASSALLTFSEEQARSETTVATASCAPSMCDVDDRKWLNETSGTMPLSSSSTSLYSSNEECSFIIKCPLGNDYVRVTCDGEFANHLDALWFDHLEPSSAEPNGFKVTNPGNRWYRPSGLSNRRMGPFLMPQYKTFIRMRFKATNAAYNTLPSPGLGCSYLCFDSLQPTPQPAPVTQAPPDVPNETPRPSPSGNTPQPASTPRPPVPTPGPKTPTPTGNGIPSSQPSGSATPSPNSPSTPLPPGATPSPGGNTNPTSPTAPPSPGSTPSPAGQTPSPSGSTPSPNGVPTPGGAAEDDTGGGGGNVGGIVGGVVGALVVVGLVAAGAVFYLKKQKAASSAATDMEAEELEYKMLVTPGGTPASPSSHDTEMAPAEDNIL